MPYTPTSPVGIALAQLRRMVSLSATFQAAMGAVDTADALTFILMGRHQFCSLPVEGGAIIYLSDSPVEFEVDAGGAQLWLHPTGGIVVQLVLPQPDIEDEDERYFRGVDFCADLAEDVKALSDSQDTGTEFGSNHLAITNIKAEYIAPSNVQHDHSRGKLFLAKLYVSWGID